MFDQLRQSLALRLAWQYALMFALCVGVLFGVLYWMLARSLEQRDQEAVARRADDFAAVFEVGGPAGLSELLHNDTAPDVRTLFVRLISTDNTAVFVAAPPDWIETQVEHFPVPEWEGVIAERKTETVRVPQNAMRDYTIASHPLPNGWVLQVGRLTDSRPVLLAPLRKAFVGVGAAALLLSVGGGTLLAWRATRPLRLVADTARRILETGDLAARVPEFFPQDRDRERGDGKKDESDEGEFPMEINDRAGEEQESHAVPDDLDRDLDDCDLERGRIVGDAAHDFARAVPVKEIEREVLEVLIEALADVAHDGLADEIHEIILDIAEHALHEINQGERDGDDEKFFGVFRDEDVVHDIADEPDGRRREERHHHHGQSRLDEPGQIGLQEMQKSFIDHRVFKMEAAARS